MVWSYPLTFDPQAAFLCICSVSLIPRGGSGDPFSLSSNRILHLSVLAMTIALTRSQETNTDYLPCFCCYFPFGGQTGAECKCLSWSSPISYTKACEPTPVPKRANESKSLKSGSFTSMPAHSE